MEVVEEEFILFEASTLVRGLPIGNIPLIWIKIMVDILRRIWRSIIPRRRCGP